MNSIGFITNCLPMNLVEKIKVAHKLGYQTLEVSCWPVGGEKQCDINADSYDNETLMTISQVLQHEHMAISTLAYYDNMLCNSLELRAAHLRHLRNVIRLAHKMGVPYVATYIGKNTLISLTDNFLLAGDIFKPIVDYAEAMGVMVLIENCPMPTWDPEGNPGTITYTPELIYELFQTIDSSALGLNFDPSHLYWQRIDYMEAAKSLSPWIKSLHVKDVTLNRNNIDRYGMYGKKLERTHKYDFGYYTATLPGYGDLHWLDLLHVLRANGFCGPLQVEYKNGNGYGKLDDDIHGLELSAQYLQEIMELEAKL